MGLKKIRQNRRLSQRELAEQSGINMRSLQDYEQGHKDIASAKAETIYRLSLALGCSMEEIIEDHFIEIEWNAVKVIETNDRLCAYDLNISRLREQIENQKIFSEKYKVNARWKVFGDSCIILFLYKGELVQLPFEAYFSEDRFPWLADAAALKINSYIRDRIFNERYGIKVGDRWDEF